MIRDKAIESNVSLVVWRRICPSIGFQAQEGRFAGDKSSILGIFVSNAPLVGQNNDKIESIEIRRCIYIYI